MLPQTTTEPFIMVPVSVAFNTSLSDKARTLWAALERFSGQHLTCWPGYTALAKLVGCSARWIPVLIKELVKAGLLVVQSRPGKANIYTLLGRVTRQATPTHEAVSGQPWKPSAGEQKAPTKTNNNNVNQWKRKAKEAGAVAYMRRMGLKV